MLKNNKLFFKPSVLNTPHSTCALTNTSLQGNVALSDAFAKLTKPKVVGTEGTTDKQEKDSGTASLPIPFVFGQNLSDRVENIPKPAEVEEEKIIDKDLKNQTADNASSSIASTFHDEIKENTQNAKVIDIHESARLLSQQIQDSKKVEGLTDESSKTTGEEGEITVIKAMGKLYEFSTSQGSWIEKGSGYLKLNDSIDKSQCLKSRLIMRNQGIRVILNTPVFSQMGAENPNHKTLRFLGLATPEDQSSTSLPLPSDEALSANTPAAAKFKPYLFKAHNATDIENLTSALNSRINNISQSSLITADDRDKVLLIQGNLDEKSFSNSPAQSRELENETQSSHNQIYHQTSAPDKKHKIPPPIEKENSSKENGEDGTFNEKTELETKDQLSASEKICHKRKNEDVSDSDEPQENESPPKKQP